MQASYSAKLILVLILTVVTTWPVISKGQDLSNDNEQTEFYSFLEERVINNPDTVIFILSNHYEDFAYVKDPVLLKLMADAYYFKNDFQKAIEYYSLSAEKIKAENGTNNNEYASRLNDVGYCYYMMGYYASAVSHYNSALHILEKLDSKADIYDTYNNLATVYFLIGDYDNSIAHFEEVLEYDKKSNNNHNISLTFNNIAKVYDAWGKIQSSGNYYQRALKYAIADSSLRLQSVILSNLGMLYFKQNNIDSALWFIDSALQLSITDGNKFKIAIRKSELAKALIQKQEFDQAKALLTEALTFFTENKINNSIVIVLQDIGVLYMKDGHFDKSEQYFIESISLSDSVGLLREMMLGYKSLSELYHLEGKYDLAFENYKTYDSLNQLLFSNEKHKQLADFETKYEANEKELENVRLKNNVIRKQNHLNLLYILIIGFVIIALLAVIVFSQRYKYAKQQQLVDQYKLKTKEQEKQHLEDKIFAEKKINLLQKQKHDEYIQYKNQLLTTTTLNLINKNDFLISLKKKVDTLNDENLKRELLSLINNNIDVDQNWKKFSLEFDSLHPGFMDKLKANYPDLSDNFLQLCSYLRINLSTKEIAQIQNISVAAVNKNRQRLRKKLNLEPETDLNTFLGEL